MYFYYIAKKTTIKLIVKDIYVKIRTPEIIISQHNTEAFNLRTICICLIPSAFSSIIQQKVFKICFLLLIFLLHLLNRNKCTQVCVLMYNYRMLYMLTQQRANVSTSKVGMLQLSCYFEYDSKSTLNDTIHWKTRRRVKSSDSTLRRSHNCIFVFLSWSL